MKLATTISLLLLNICSIISQKNIEFEHYVTPQNGLTGNYFFSIVEDNYGYIWIGGNNGIQRYSNHHFKNFNSLLSHTHVLSLFVDRKENIWICTLNGLHKFNPGTEEVKIYFPDIPEVQSISSQRIETITETDDGFFWIGTGNGLFSFDPNTETFTPYLYDLTKGDMSSNRYYSIKQDVENKNTLWIGSQSGFYQFDRSNKTFTLIPLSNYSKSVKSYLESDILGLYQLSDGRILLGSGSDDRILIYNPKTKVTETKKIQTGEKISPHREQGVYDFYPKSENEIFVSAVKSIGIFNIENDQYKPFNLGGSMDKNNALSSAARHIFIDSKGFLWLPSLAGISKSKRPVITRPPKKSRLLISDISVNQISKHPTQIELLKPIEMPLDATEISVEFGFPNLGYFENVTYNYRLLGQSNTWNETDTGFIEFNHLKGGEYLLELRGKTDESDWSQTESIAFSIEVAWWKTWWFKLIVLSSLIGLGLLFWGINMMHKRREKNLTMEFDKNLALVQMEALRAQMNPHFLFNSMNSINHYILRNEPEKASSYLTKFARLIRQILHNSKSKSVSLSEELDALKLYIDIEKLRFADGFEFQLFVDPEIQLEQIDMPPMLIQPYVENAIWHGLMHKDNNRKLSIQIIKNDGLIQMIIRDNGIGREASKAYNQSPDKKKSLGIQITNDQVALVNQLYGANADIEIIDLKDSNGKALGTEVIVSLPT